MCSLQDGYLQVNNAFDGKSATFPDVPGSYHRWGCGFSFADGHSELHKWVTTVIKIPVRAHYSNGGNILAGPKNEDWQWFQQHAACRMK
jgi:hypothetical protein